MTEYCAVVEPVLWTDSFETNAKILLSTMGLQSFKDTRVLKVVFETDDGTKIFLPELGTYCSLLYVEYCLLVFGDEYISQMIFDADFFFARLWGSNNKFVSALANAYAMKVELRN